MLYFSLLYLTLGLLVLRGDAGALSYLHGGCNSALRSRYPECVSSMHRFCRLTYYFGYSHIANPMGVSREVGQNGIRLSCISSTWFGHVSVSTLRLYHGGCTLHGSQRGQCLSAIHRYCSGHYGANYAGMAQEVGNGFFAVGCFYAPLVRGLRWSALTSKHSGCFYPNSDSANCYSAISRWCALRGYRGGISQEVTSSHVTVACYRAFYSRNVHI